MIDFYIRHMGLVIFLIFFNIVILSITSAAITINENSIMFGLIVLYYIINIPMLVYIFRGYSHYKQSNPNIVLEEKEQFIRLVKGVFALACRISFPSAIVLAISSLYGLLLSIGLMYIVVVTLNYPSMDNNLIKSMEENLYGECDN